MSIGFEVGFNSHSSFLEDALSLLLVNRQLLLESKLDK